MANNIKQPNKCHFNIKGQNNEVSITKIKWSQNEKNYSNIRQAVIELEVVKSEKIKFHKETEHFI